MDPAFRPDIGEPGESRDVQDIGDIVWWPEPGNRQGTRLGSFCETMGVADRRALDRLASTDPATFWIRAASWLGVAWDKAPSQAFDPAPAPRGAWFPGGQVDVHRSLLGRWLAAGRGAERVISWEREDGQRGDLTFDQLGAEVARVASGLTELGVTPGERVAVQLPLSPEAVITFIAAASIGAIVVPLYTGFGAAATAQRIARSDASVLIATTGFQRRGKWIDGPASAETFAASLPASVRTILVDRQGSGSRGDRRRIDWDGLEGSSFQPQAFASEETILIAFTSGTTGRPKGVALPAAGTLLKTGTDVAWLFDVGPGDRASWITDPGWIMGPIIIYGALMAGGTLALYDGAPDWPDAQRLWNFVRGHRLSMMGISPTLVRSLMSHPEPAEDALGSLRVLGASGEPWSPDAFEWLFSRVGRGRIPIINYSGGTEVAGAILTNTTSEPIGNGTFAGPVPGMGAQVVDSSGEPVEDVVGDLVLSHSSPAMATTFWGDHERYLETYWSQLPGRWLHGDWATASADGPWRLHGRSDDTMKVAGRRIGPAEVESIVNGHPDVTESAAVSVPDARSGERLVVVAATPTLPESAGDRELTATEIADLVMVQLGKPFRPREVVLTPALPRTRSGKIMRRLVRALARGETELGDLSALEDPAAIEATREAIITSRIHS